MVEPTPYFTPPLPSNVMAERESAVAKIAQAIADTLDGSQVFPITARLARQVLPYDVLLTLLVQNDPFNPILPRLSVNSWRKDDSVWETTTSPGELWWPAQFSFGPSLLAGHPMIVDDLALLAPQHPGDVNLLESGRAMLLAPICAGANTLGGLVFASSTPGAYTTGDLFWAERLTDLLAVALEHQRLNRLALHDAVTEERSRLAGELHDSLAQSLAGIIINLEALKQSAVTNVRADAEVLLETDMLAHRALEETRRLVLGLYPAALEHQPLSKAMSEELAGLARRNGLVTQFHCSGQERILEPEQTAALFRIAQEAFQNIQKHAAAQHVVLGLTFHSDAVVLAIEDDGVGFQPALQMPSEQGGFGQFLMAERAHSLGGTLEITSRQGHGTMVRVTLPYITSHAPFPALVTAATTASSSKRPIRVLVVDNHTVVRQGIRRILEGISDIEIVGEAEDGLTAIALTERYRPDVILLDVQMPHLSGIAALPQLRAAHPGVEVVMMTMFNHDEAVFASLRAGARGYVLKDAPPEMFVAAVRAVSRGQSLLPPSLATHVGDRLAALVRQQQDPDSLTARELEVLQMMAKGLHYKDIAAQLGVTIKTVESHVTHIRQKLHVDSRSKAVALAQERGMIDDMR